MNTPRSSCSGLDAAGPEFDKEFRNILDALFCACLEELQDTDTRLRRDLFRLTEMDGQTPAVAARALHIGISEAKEMLARTRRDIAVLIALGLCKPEAPGPVGPVDRPRTFDCGCGNTASGRRRHRGRSPRRNFPARPADPTKKIR